MAGDHLTATTASPRVRLRAVATGLVLAICICLYTPMNNVFHRATPLGGGHFPLAPFFFLLLLALLVSLVAWLGKSRLLLNGSELLIIWVQMVIGSGIAYTGLARTFLINLTAPVYFASSGNRWQENLQPLLPESLLLSDRQAIDLLYNGLPGGRTMDWLDVVTAVPWQAWLPALLRWGLFIMLCYLVMIFIVNLFARQWIVNEKLNFPLLRVPLFISYAVDSGDGAIIFANRFLLAGLSVPVLLHLLNGLNLYFPSVPRIETIILAGSYFPDQGLLSGFAKLKLSIYPAFIGFAFLTSRQISFSFWFFFLAGGLLYGVLNMLGYIIPAAALGISFGPTLTRPEEMQMFGAYGVFFLFLVWLARRHLLEAGRRSLLLAPSRNGHAEWFDIRFSFWGILLGFLLLVLWFSWQGVAPLTGFLLISAFFMISLVATRIICQGGLAYFTLTAAPIDGLIILFGSKLFAGVGGLVGAISQKVLFVDLRESLLPSLLHGKKIHHEKQSIALIFSALLVTILLSVIASIGAMMTVCYRYGIRELDFEWASNSTLTVYENAYRLIVNPVPSGDWVYIFGLIGALVMLVLVVCYQRFYWWPIHPIGYLTAYSSAMRILWISFFLGWLGNVLCMKYGGVNLFRKMQFFFIGLIIGDFLMGGIWAIVGYFSFTSYLVFPD